MFSRRLKCLQYLSYRCSLLPQRSSSWNSTILSKRVFSSESDQQGCSVLLRRAGNLLRSGQSSDAEPLLIAARQLAAKDSNRALSAEATLSLALLRSQCNDSSALELFEDGLKDAVAASLPNDVIIMAKLQQANALCAFERRKDAVAPLKEAVQLIEETHGAEHEMLPCALNNLAGAHSAAGSADEAVESAKRALEIFEKSVGKRSKYTRTTKENLAFILKSAGRHQEAEEILAQSDFEDNVVMPDPPSESELNEWVKPFEEQPATDCEAAGVQMNDNFTEDIFKKYVEKTNSKNAFFKDKIVS